MNRRITTLVASVLLCGSFSAASGASLGLAPAAVSATPGGSFTLDLVVTGLGDMEAVSLGDFDINLGFDAAALSFVGYSLGASLGDLAAVEAADFSFGIVAPGVLNLAEVSLLSIAELDATQSATFVLATVEFMLSGLAPGDSTAVDIAAVLALGDSGGSPIAVDGTSSALITAAIPLPAAVWLFAAAVFSLALRRPRTQ